MTLDELFKEFEDNGPPFASKDAKFQYEAFRDYFQPKLEALISDKVREARIEELENLKRYLIGNIYDENNQLSGDRRAIIAEITKRLTELKKGK